MAESPKVPASLILGTAGHIDHGKSSLVRALTGVDTDRLAEEQARGITIELGFAPWTPTPACAFGIVDVPGHEGFVRTMVAGATGMDLVLLVVAADEGVMPQTREHLAIVKLLGVEAMVVAITKSDLIDDPEWLELVGEDVRSLLRETPYADSAVVPVSIHDPASLAALADALVQCGARARKRRRDDLFRLPVDRVFAREGAGTVVTGTLWSGRVARGDTVRILPGGGEARVRALQLHGHPVDEARAGQRTALALTGTSVRRGQLSRGDVLVADPAWTPSMMLTVQITALAETGWRLETGQRVRIHLGTVEVMARLVLFDLHEAAPGVPALGQLRLEGQVIARAGDRFVIRSWSPMTTIAGGVVLEPSPNKRKRIRAEEGDALMALAGGGEEAVRGGVALAAWQGLAAVSAGVQTGWTAPATALPGVSDAMGGRLFDPAIVARAEERILSATARYHSAYSLHPGVPLATLRSALPARAHPALADGIVARLVAAEMLVVEGRVARLPGFQVVLSAAEEEVAGRIEEILGRAGLQGPSTEEIVAAVGSLPDTVLAVLNFLAGRGRILLLSDAFWVATDELEAAAARVVAALGGREGMGPAEFREVLPLTRKHLIPLLAHLDGRGITERGPDGRRVAESLES